jgi:hypothetical protein
VTEDTAKAHTEAAAVIRNINKMWRLPLSFLPGPKNTQFVINDPRWGGQIIYYTSYRIASKDEEPYNVTAVTRLVQEFPSLEANIMIIMIYQVTETSFYKQALQIKMLFPSYIHLKGEKRPYFRNAVITKTTRNCGQVSKNTCQGRNVGIL